MQAGVGEKGAAAAAPPPTGSVRGKRRAPKSVEGVERERVSAKRGKTQNTGPAPRTNMPAGGGGGEEKRAMMQRIRAPEKSGNKLPAPQHGRKPPRAHSCVFMELVASSTVSYVECKVLFCPPAVCLSALHTSALRARCLCACKRPPSRTHKHT